MIAECRQNRRDRGATAVEFALLVPLLLLLVFGIIDFGRALNAQITITQAAREGARLASVGQPASAVQARTVGAATGLGLAAGNVVVSGGSGAVSGSAQACPAGSAAQGLNATVTVTYTFRFVTPVAALASFGATLTQTAQGVMPCEM